MIMGRTRCLTHLSILMISLFCSALLAAQVSPTPTVTQGDPNYASDWAQWLNDQMPQAVPQETIALGGVEFNGTSWAYECGGLHMTWAGFPTTQTTPPPFACGGGGGRLVTTSLSAPVVQINSYNERYQILIAKPNNLDLHDLQAVLYVPTLGGGSESFTATLEQSSSPTGLGPRQSLIGGILATIAFHPRTSLPQTLRIWSDAARVEGDYTIVPYLKPQLGGFVVPYLPVTIVYQPVGCGIVPSTNPPITGGSSAVFTVTAQVGTTFSWGNFNTSGTVQTASSDDFFKYLKDGTDVAAFGAGLIPGGQPVAAALETVGKVAEALDKVLPNTQTTVTSTNTQGHSETQGWVISSSQGYGTQVCDPEDRYVYMRNVLFAYAVVPKDPVSNQFTPTGIPTVILAPIHFDAPVNADLLSDLKRNVPPAVLAQFLGLRAQIPKQMPGGAVHHVPAQNTVLGPSVGFNIAGAPRLVPWPPGADINESVVDCPVDAPNYVDFGKEDLTSYEISQVTTTTTVTKVSGLIAQFMGQGGETTQSLTISGAKNNWESYKTDSKVTLECPEIKPNYSNREMDVWFDTVMGTLFAIPNGILVPYGQQSQIQGTSSPHTAVALKIGGKRYQVLSDAKGRFAFRFASIPKGSGVLVSGNQTLPIAYNGLPLPNDFKLGSGVIASSNTSGGANPASVRSPNIPCCPITSIDAAAGAVTARVTGADQSFQFTVKDSALLRSLKVGQGVFANLKTRQVSINGTDVCCQIRSFATAKAGATPPTTGGSPATPSPAGQPRSSGACCRITAINQQTGILTAKVDATGQTLQFAVKDPALLRSLKVGQGVFANFKTQQVSLDGKQACCNILR